MTVLITGGTGLVGTALTEALLQRQFSVIVMTRNPKPETRNPKPETRNPKLSYAIWSIAEKTLDRSSIGQADYIVHLAGASVAEKRWTRKRKQEIIDSRTKSSALLVKALSEIPNKVKAVISASAIGWYGENKLPFGQTITSSFVETDPPAEDFLGNTCKLWEDSIEPVSLLGKRLVKLRTGIVLSNEGGALSSFRKALRFGIAPILSNGMQVISWIHIDDLVRLIMFALDNEELQGVYNAVAPKPVTNRELVLTMARRIKGKFHVPVYIPSFLLELVLGDMSMEVLKSTHVSSDKIQSAGFIFQYPHISTAMKSLFSPVAGG